MCRNFLRGSSPKYFRNLTEEVLFAFLFVLSIHKLWAVMVLLQRLEAGLQPVHGTLLMAQGQWRSEHKAEAEQLQQASVWDAGVVCRFFALLTPR